MRRSLGVLNLRLLVRVISEFGLSVAGLWDESSGVVRSFQTGAVIRGAGAFMEVLFPCRWGVQTLTAQGLGEDGATFAHKVENRRIAVSHPRKPVAELKSKMTGQ
jgi:hypothetical protein